MKANGLKVEEKNDKKQRRIQTVKNLEDTYI